MEPESINTAYTVSANMPLSHNLGKNVANISIEKPPYRGEPCHFIATADLPQKTGNIVNIDNTFTQKYNENFENVLNQKYTVITEHNFNNDSLLNNSYNQWRPQTSTSTALKDSSSPPAMKSQSYLTFRFPLFSGIA